MKFYDAYNAEYYTKRKRQSKKHMMKYLNFQRTGSSLKLLDIGCGEGHYVRDAVEEHIDAYGIDISTDALKNALSDVKHRISFGSISEIPFGDEEFDVITAFDIVEHIHPKETIKAIAEIRRVLKPHGIAIMTTPNPSYLNDWAFDLTHINVRPPKFWRLMLEESKFDVKMSYVPSFIKYYVNRHIPIPDSIEFHVEEPLRYIMGYYFSKKGRLYLVAKKSS